MSSGVSRRPTRKGSTAVRKSGRGAKAKPYWNMGVEPLLGSSKLDPIRFRRLKQVLSYAVESSAYFRARLGRRKRELDRIRSFNDFRSLVPVFTKDDQRKAQEESLAESGHAFGSTLCIPREEIRLVCATSGTTGEPTFYLFSETDLDVWCEGRSRAFWRAGLRPGMRVLIGFGLGMFVGGVPNVLAAQRFGMGVVPVGAEGGATKILKFASLTQTAALMATPSLAEHLVEKAPETIGKEVKSLGLRALLLGGEPGAGIPSVRKKLQDAYGAAVYDLQGPNMSCSEPEYQGMHRLMDDYHFYELVDPETKQPLELANGAVGELVTTQLWKGAAPFIRYSAGDLQQIFLEPCRCGLSGVRSRMVGRTDDMLKVKGVMIYPAAIKNVIGAFLPEVTGEFRIVLNQPPPLVNPPLKLKVEYADLGAGVSAESPGVGARQPAPPKRLRRPDASPLQDLERRLKDSFHASLKVTPDIQWVPPRTLPRTAKKTDYFERLYAGR